MLLYHVKAGRGYINLLTAWSEAECTVYISLMGCCFVLVVTLPMLPLNKTLNHSILLMLTC